MCKGFATVGKAVRYVGCWMDGLGERRCEKICARICGIWAHFLAFFFEKAISGKI